MSICGDSTVCPEMDQATRSKLRRTKLQPSVRPSGSRETSRDVPCYVTSPHQIIGNIWDARYRHNVPAEFSCELVSRKKQAPLD